MSIMDYKAKGLRPIDFYISDTLHKLKNYMISNIDDDGEQRKILCSLNRYNIHCSWWFNDLNYFDIN